MMNIYADTVIINEGGEAPAGNPMIVTPEDSKTPLGVSYTELNAIVESGRDVIVRFPCPMNSDKPVKLFELFRLDSYGLADEGHYFASFWGHSGHVEYRAPGPDDMLVPFLM